MKWNLKEYNSLDDRAIIIKQKLFIYLRRPQNSFEPHPDPKNRPLGSQKIKNNPKIKSESNVRIEGTKGNKSFSATWVDPKTVYEPNPDPKNSP